MSEVSMVERVARALFRQEFAESPAVLPYEDDEWPGFVDIANAAIAAVREHDGEVSP